MKVRIVVLFLCVVGACQPDRGTFESSRYFTDSIYSKHLSEYRKHNVYLPQGFDPAKDYPIVYETDGATISENSFIKRTLDSLISNKIIKPIIIVESHANINIADSTSVTFGNGEPVKLMFRNFEYIPDYNLNSNDPDLQNRFFNHMLYFRNELIPSVERKFEQTITGENRYFFGVSNGAGFGMNLLNFYPNLIGTYLCYSDMGGHVQTNVWNIHTKYPRLQYVYGTAEADLIDKSAQKLKEVYSTYNSRLEIIVYEGGHDYKFWQKYYSLKLEQLFKI